MIGVIPCIPQHTVSTKTMYRAKRWDWVCFCVINQYTAWASLKSSDYYWPEPEAVGGPYGYYCIYPLQPLWATYRQDFFQTSNYTAPM